MIWILTFPCLKLYFHVTFVKADAANILRCFGFIIDWSSKLKNQNNSPIYSWDKICKKSFIHLLQNIDFTLNEMLFIQSVFNCDKVNICPSLRASTRNVVSSGLVLHLWRCGWCIVNTTNAFVNIIWKKKDTCVKHFSSWSVGA